MEEAVEGGITRQKRWEHTRLISACILTRENDEMGPRTRELDWKALILFYSTQSTGDVGTNCLFDGLLQKMVCVGNPILSMN